MNIEPVRKDDSMSPLLRRDRELGKAVYACHSAPGKPGEHGFRNQPEWDNRTLSLRAKHMKNKREKGL